MKVSLLPTLLALGWVQFSWFLWLPTSESLSLRSRSSSLSKKLSLWRPSILPKATMKTNLPSPLYVSDNARTLERPPLKERFASIFASKSAEDDESAAPVPPTIAAAPNAAGTAIAAGSSPTTSATADSEFLPSYRSLIVFTATTIIIWLSEPLLSLVDTTIVGLTSASRDAVVQIAALGPATTLFDSAIYLTYSLAIATTNQLAPALARKDWKNLRRSTSHLMGLALFFGCLVSVIVFGWGRQLITQMVGPMTEASIIPLATNYARIRAMTAPFCVVGFVAQSFCLTTLDTRTPALAMAVASIVNVVGDLALSPKWGIQGAAVATALATAVSCIILVAKVRRTTAQWKVKQDVAAALAEVSEASATTRSEESSSPSSEVLETSTLDVNMQSGKSSGSASTDIPFWSLPNKASTMELVKLTGPIFLTMMAKIACYSVMTIRATNFGIKPLAAHNIMMRVFFFFACFGDSLSQATQSFFPQVSKKLQGKLLTRLAYIAGVVGVCNHQVSQLVLRQFGRFLTKDASIIHMMSEYSPFVGAAILLHPFIMLFEGTVLAKRDLVFMVGMYILTGLFHFGFVFSPVSATFYGLWRALFVFQFIRLIQFAARVWDTSRRERKAAMPGPADPIIPAPYL